MHFIAPVTDMGVYSKTQSLGEMITITYINEL
jgi:hypothetical protein